tara:strand:- start:182 stop:745 length:564 start_codon:yes stop_codon:yes gene_type:complete
MSVDVFKPQLVSLLPELGYSGVEMLSRYLTTISVQKGDIIIKQGSTQKDVFFPMNGTFSVFEQLKINDSDVVLKTATFPGPSIIGEVSILTETKRTASVIAMDGADCLILRKDKIDALIMDYPVLVVELFKTFASILYDRQAALKQKIWDTALKEGNDIDDSLEKLSKYTGKATKVSAEFANMLFET